MRRLWMAFAIAALPSLGFAEAGPAGHPEAELQNLTPLNFFTAGWAEDWRKRPRYTPDMALLRVTTNFLERELRLDYVYTAVSGNPKLNNTQLANSLIAYGLNRRLMIEAITNYQWNQASKDAGTNGAGGGFLTRFQLADTPGQSYAVQVRVTPPNKGIGQTQTTLSYALAGWQDVHDLLPALGRCGLYFSLQYDNTQGPAKAGTTFNTLSYDVSLAETWTAPTTPVFGNFTTFLETFASTPLDGAKQNKTVFTLTPGIRFWFVPENSLSLGVDLYVSHDPPNSAVYRATYILNF